MRMRCARRRTGQRRWRGPRRLQHQIFVGFGLRDPDDDAGVGWRCSCCFTRRTARGPWLRACVLFVAGNVLWTFVGRGRAAHRAAAARAGARRERARRRQAREPRAAAARAARSRSASWPRAFNDMAARIEAQVKSQQELLGAASHELRTPLARLRVLLRCCRTAAPTRSSSPSSSARSSDMDALVGELLAGARVEAGALVKRTLDAARHRARVRRALGPAATCAVEIDDDARSVHADATLLSRALTILLDNARKHGGAHVRVRVMRAKPRASHSASKTTGRGFDAADLPRVFEPFARGRGQAPDEQPRRRPRAVPGAPHRARARRRAFRREPQPRAARASASRSPAKCRAVDAGAPACDRTAASIAHGAQAPRRAPA